MNKEGTLIDFLTKESEKIAEESLFFTKMRQSVPSYDLSAWNDEVKYLYPSSISNKQSKYQSPIYSTDSLIKKYSLPPDLKANQRSTSNLLRKPVRPVVYQVHNLFSNSPKSQPSNVLKSLEKKESVQIKKLRPRIKVKKGVLVEMKKVKNLSELLKPGNKNPVISIVFPRLRSKSDMFRYNSKNILGKKPSIIF